MGQVADPYQEGEDEVGLTISGLPGEPHEPEVPEGAGGETVVYDLDDWSEIEREAVTDRLREAGIPHVWAGTELQVADADEGPVDNILDLVEGGGPALAPGRDQVAYDLSDWDDDGIDTVAHELRAAGIASGWDGDELFVHADDEPAVDELLDRVAHPHQLAAEPDDGPVGAELLGEIFVAADRLQHDPEDGPGVAAVIALGERVEGSEPPYGLDAAEWSRLGERVGELRALLEDDAADLDEVAGAAFALRRALRPYV
ncbi:MAG TPA: hypothetical protein VFZ77_21150 [Acidimicrobiales bacterium]